MPEKASPLFFDTVVLSNFSLIGSFQLIQKRYQNRLAITDEVYNEIAQGIARGFTGLSPVSDCIHASTCTRHTLQMEAKKMYTGLLPVLGSGEASCIAAAYTNNGIVVTDDKKARKCCEDYSVRFTGTIGILKQLRVSKTISTDGADIILQKMISAGFYSPVTTISELF